MRFTKEKIIILDFGSQYTQLIARRIRANGVYSEILPFSAPTQKLQSNEVKGIVLSGGPHSVYDKNAPCISSKILRFGIPVLGICYGHQLISHIAGGDVEKTKKSEYGYAHLIIKRKAELLKGIPRASQVWMSHGDRILKLPPHFETLAQTENTDFAIIKHKQLPVYGLQFHPEVTHTTIGNRILKNFLFKVCKCTGDWDMSSFIETSKQEIMHTVKHRKVILGLSGGVDSAVAATLIKQAIGDSLFVIFINNGLLRKGEPEAVIENFHPLFKKKFFYVDAENEFLHALQGAKDPEKKRKIIGKTFIKIFEREAKKIKNIMFLAQGTLYPDRIESMPVQGPSSTIKSHHNVGGLPEKMHLKLIEPCKNLFKDEVREVGKLLKLSDTILSSHPFPGPGLAVRIIGTITKMKLRILREADTIFIDEIKRNGLYNKIWQAFCVLLPVKTVGVMGDKRTYEHVIALRAITSSDGMTADWYPFTKRFLTAVCNRIINGVTGINRVVYDISSKPPATIEWE
ncbi:MAG: glutamine-hydrolyzing GMP synthase [Candidatus Cloacimonadota bacterium]|nr:MAG: glutamine-hydrolyzing GMP synthase [Candidatus Cloacimonadota bacterium]